MGEPLSWRHASCVAIDGKALLIIGQSGSGKSALALQMVALGADLVADDMAGLRRDGERVIARAPDAAQGRIEARGMGILTVPAEGPGTPETEVIAVVDMDQIEQQRLPSARFMSVLDRELPVLYRVDGLYFASALILFLKSGGALER